VIQFPRTFARRSGWTKEYKYPVISGKRVNGILVRINWTQVEHRPKPQTNGKLWDLTANSWFWQNRQLGIYNRAEGHTSFASGKKDSSTPVILNSAHSFLIYRRDESKTMISKIYSYCGVLEHIVHSMVLLGSEQCKFASSSAHHRNQSLPACVMQMDFSILVVLSFCYMVSVNIKVYYKL
jgi:hypothetical protein